MNGTTSDEPAATGPVDPAGPKPLDEPALSGVAGGKTHFDDGVTTFWDPATGQVTINQPGG